MAEKPKASSTPKIVDVKGRPGIGDRNNETVQSPINPLRSPGSIRRRHIDSNSEDEKSDAFIDSNDETDDVNKAEQNLTNRTFCNCINSLFVILIVVTLLSMFLLYIYGDENIKETPSLERLSREFPSQVEDFWLYIQVGIQEITKLHQPRTFLFLYNDESQKTLDNIVDEISQFAVCILTSCSAIPVILKGSDLNSSDILQDYGKIIEANKEKLEENGVMIIKNLEKIPGISAQAFHSFCDEYHPIVEKALFIFTMKVDKFHENNVKFAENYLHDLWNDITDDKFYPLFTRISSHVLPVMVER